MSSLNTFPGPTDSSWSLSPTKTILLPVFIFIIRLVNRCISTMLHSSMMIKSSQSISPAFHASSPSAPVSPILLCIVNAGYPVASYILCRALPVGAANKIILSIFNFSWIITIKRSRVVFPLPGPPVIMEIEF